MAHPNRLENARVFVFGGTSGIGFAVASMALSSGAYVTISGSKQPKVDDKVALLRSYYPNVSPDKVNGFACDLADTPNLEANLKELFDKTTSNGQNKVDHIAFTAGDLVNLAKIQVVKVEDIAPGFAVRFTGAIMIAKLLITGTYMPATANSSFTITGGTNTHKPMPGFTIGAGWGGALDALSRGLAVDLKPIRVNIVEPGAIQTELFARWGDKLGEEGLKKLMATQTLTNTMGQPSDTAEAYGWIMRDRFVTGISAKTDGGRILAGSGDF